VSGAHLQISFDLWANSREEVADLIKRFRAGMSEAGLNPVREGTLYSGNPCDDNGERITW
jgi:hypothetical protein